MKFWNTFIETYLPLILPSFDSIQVTYKELKLTWERR